MPNEKEIGKVVSKEKRLEKIFRMPHDTDDNECP